MEKETRERHHERRFREIRRRQLRIRRLIVCGVVAFLTFLIGFVSGWMLRGCTIRKPVELSSIQAPAWIEQQFISINPYSRPGTKLAAVNGIVVHYVGNPGTTAQQNRDYFQGLKNQSGSNTTSVSSHFIIGMDGEIIQCIPVDEKAFASNQRNADTIAIECCHPEEDGVFTEATYESLIKLTAWLCKELNLTPKEVIRHYDVTGKSCPKAFVEDEDAWKQFQKDLKKAMRRN